MKQESLLCDDLFSDIDDNHYDSLFSHFWKQKEHKVLSSGEINKLIIKFKEQGDREAREIVIRSHIRLVHFWAQKFSWSSIDFFDLVQEGCIGLLQAIERFDVSKGVKFSLYATFWVKAKIRKVIYGKGYNVYLPMSAVRVRSELFRDIKFLKRKQMLKEGYDKDPTIEEIAEYVGKSEEKVRQILFLFDVSDISFDKLLGNDDSLTLYDFVSDHRFLGCEQMFEAKEILKESIEFVEEVLSFIEATQSFRNSSMFKMRYKPNARNTLQKVGEEFDVTRERVRQIMNNTWEKLSKISFPRTNEKEFLLMLESISELEVLTGSSSEIQSLFV